MTTEQERREYYQKIVYDVCNFIDSKIGDKTVSGTADNPSDEVMERLKQAWKESILIVEAEQVEESPVWIEWSGGECPVFGRAFVEFETRIGTTGKRRAHELVWQHGILDIVAYRVVPDDQPAEPEKQPQPGWYMVGIGKRGPYLYVGPDDEGDLVFQTGKNTFENFVWDVECRHLPDCTGFDYVPPPEETPAEMRLRELGIERDTDGDYRSVTHRTVLGLSDFTSEQLEAIAAHMREQEGAQ